MAEYDAFGRKVGENDPAIAPSDAPPTPTPTPPPAVSADTPAEPPPAAPPPAPTGLTLSGRPGRSFGGGGGGSGARWFFVAVMLAVSIGGAIIAITATNSVDKTIRKYIPTFPAVTVSPETTPTTSTT